MRRIICIIAAALLVSGNALALPRFPDSGTDPDVRYTDVKASDWFAADVYFVADRGYMMGKNVSSFAPFAVTTRGEFIAALARFAEVAQYRDGETGFEDVSRNNYLAPYVMWAVENGVARGVSDSKFAPDEPITREQITVMLYGYARYADCVLPDAEPRAFVDVSWVSDWAIDAVEFMSRAGLIYGREDGWFDPQGLTLRCEAAAMLHRFVEAVEDAQR